MYGRNYSEQAQNAHFAIGDTGIKLLFGCILALGFWAYFGYFVNNMDEGKSALWPTESATLKEIGQQSLGMPIIGRFLPITCPFAKYTYTVNGKEYSGQANYGPSLSFVRLFSFKPPKPKAIDTEEMTKKLGQEERAAIAMGAATNFQARLDRTMQTAQELAEHPTYDPVKVRYDRDHPEISVLDPDVMQSGKSQMYTSFILIVLGGGLLGGVFMHQHLTAPNPDDPSLNLDAALAAQRKRRS